MKTPSLSEVKEVVAKNDRSKGLMTYLYFHEMITEAPYTDAFIVEKIKEALNDRQTAENLKRLKPHNVKIWRNRYKNIVIEGVTIKGAEASTPSPTTPKEEKQAEQKTEEAPLFQIKSEDDIRKEIYEQKKAAGKLSFIERYK